MLEIIKDKITKSGVVLSDKEILKHIDEPFFVERQGVLKKEITLEEVKNVLIAYPSLLTEYKYLKELVIRGDFCNDIEIEKEIDYMIRVIDHVNNKKIDNLYVVDDGKEYSTTFIKLKDLYRLKIRYGINRVFGVINDLEVLTKEYDDDVSLNSFFTTLNMELDFLTDEEVVQYRKEIFKE